MSKATYLSKKHGVNPSVTQCWYCGEDDALVLFGRVGGQRAADMGWGNNPTEYDVEAPSKICCGPLYLARVREEAVDVAAVAVAIAEQVQRKLPAGV